MQALHPLRAPVVLPAAVDVGVSYNLGLVLGGALLVLLGAFVARLPDIDLRVGLPHRGMTHSTAAAAAATMIAALVTAAWIPGCPRRRGSHRCCLRESPRSRCSEPHASGSVLAAAGPVSTALVAGGERGIVAGQGDRGAGHPRDPGNDRLASGRGGRPPLTTWQESIRIRPQQVVG